MLTACALPPLAPLAPPQVTLTSLAPGGNFVPSMWQPAGAASYTYQQWQECPTDGSPVASTADVLADISTAFSQFPYGASKVIDMDGNTPVAFAAAGEVTIVNGAGDTFTYAITEVRGSSGAWLWRLVCPAGSSLGCGPSPQPLPPAVPTLLASLPLPVRRARPPPVTSTPTPWS